VSSYKTGDGSASSKVYEDTVPSPVLYKKGYILSTADNKPLTSPNIEQIAAGLLAGEPALFPTDTVYGLGLAVGFAASPEILYDLKERDHGKPIAWLVGGEDALARYGEAVPAWVFALARAFWPGALTLVVKAGAAVPEAFRSPAGTIALRMPDNANALALIERVGVPLATTSANISGQAPPKSFDEIDTRLLAKVPLALRDYSAKSGLASTVVDCCGESPILIREGDISLEEILTV